MTSLRQKVKIATKFGFNLKPDGSATPSALAQLRSCG